MEIIKSEITLNESYYPVQSVQLKMYPVKEARDDLRVSLMLQGIKWTEEEIEAELAIHGQELVSLLLA